MADPEAVLVLPSVAQVRSHFQELHQRHWGRAVQVVEGPQQLQDGAVIAACAQNPWGTDVELTWPLDHLDLVGLGPTAALSRRVEQRVEAVLRPADGP